MKLDKGVVYEVAGAAMSAHQQHDKLHNAANNQYCPDNNFFSTGDYIIFAVGEVDLIVESHKGCNERHIKVVGI